MQFDILYYIYRDSGVLKIPSKQFRTVAASTRPKISVSSQSKLSAAATVLIETSKSNEEVYLNQRKSDSSIQIASKIFEIIKPQSDVTRKENSSDHHPNENKILNVAKSQRMLNVLNAPILKSSNSNMDSLTVNLSDDSGFSIVQNDSGTTNNITVAQKYDFKSKSELIKNILKKDDAVATETQTHAEVSSGETQKSTQLKSLLRADQSKVNKIPIMNYKPSTNYGTTEKLVNEHLVEQSCEGKKILVTSSKHFVPSKLVVRKKA